VDNHTVVDQAASSSPTNRSSSARVMRQLRPMWTGRNEPSLISVYTVVRLTMKHPRHLGRGEQQLVPEHDADLEV